MPPVSAREFLVELYYAVGNRDVVDYFVADGSTYYLIVKKTEKLGIYFRGNYLLLIIEIIEIVN